MNTLKQQLKTTGFNGELDDSTVTRDFYSHDASLFEIVPKLVVFPKDTADVKKLVSLVAANKHRLPDLSLTARAAGTDISGGTVNDSIIVDFCRHFNKIEHVSATEGQAQPGVFYRDFEVETLKHKALMPAYPASRDMATIGGMLANNAGGEKSLEYGKTKDYVNDTSNCLCGWQ